MGTIFKKAETETGTDENVRLAVALCNETADFTKIRQVLDFLMRSLDLEYEVLPTVHSSFVDGRVGRVNVEGKDVAYIGEISPVVLSSQLSNCNLPSTKTLEPLFIY